MAFSSLLVYETLARYPWWPRKVWIDISGTAALLADSPYAEQFTWILRKMGPTGSYSAATGASLTPVRQ